MGWVYVLINPSMPGLYKVGMTERSPEERVKELSSSTSVATPFIVAYQHRTFNPKELEYLVHKELEESNSRVSSNREFFEGDPSVAIRVIIRLAQESKLDSDEHYDSKHTKQPWIQFEKEAHEYLNGKGGKLQDQVRAKELFKRAEQLGSAKSTIELIKLKSSSRRLDDTSIKKLNKIRDKGVSEASYLLFKHYRSVDIVLNCVALGKEILSNKKNFEITIIQEIAFELGKIALTYCEGHGFLVHDWMDEITSQKSQSIIEVLKDFQDEIGDYHLRQLNNLKGEWSLRYKDYVVYDLCIIASLGRIFANNRLTEFGFNLTKEQVKRIQEDEYCEDADRATKQLEESNR